MKKIILIIAIFCLLPPSWAQEKKTFSSIQKYHTEDVYTYNFTINFSADSLGVWKLNEILTGAYTGGMITIKGTGTTPKIYCRTYLYDIQTNDSNYYILTGAVDTAGLTAGSLLVDTFLVEKNGLGHKWGAIVIGGAAGNREDVILYGTVTVWRKP
jgi:hypothetical protein